MKARKTIAVRDDGIRQTTFVCNSSQSCIWLVKELHNTQITWETIYKDKNKLINNVKWNFDFISDNTFQKYLSYPNIRFYKNGVYYFI